MPDYLLPYEADYERECSRHEAMDRAQERKFRELLEDDETYVQFLEDPAVWEGVKAFLRGYDPFIQKVDELAWETMS